MSHFPSPTTSLLAPLPLEMPMAPLLCLRDPRGPMNQTRAAGVSLAVVDRLGQSKKTKSHRSIKEISNNCGHCLFKPIPYPSYLNCSFHRFLSGLCFQVHGSHSRFPTVSPLPVRVPHDLVPRISIESLPAWNCFLHNLVIISVTGIKCCSYIFTE